MICCEPCNFSVCCFTEEPTLPSLECQGGQGECQLVGLSLNERCQACWLGRILMTCAMNNLLHDRLRKHLPPIVSERIPTSLSRNSTVSNKNNCTLVNSGENGEEKTSSSFGSVIDLPGGWKRKHGREIVVIGPWGEKFKSISKLRDYLLKQGINAEANFLFGNVKPSNGLPASPDSSKLNNKNEGASHLKPLNKSNNVVVTTLPGGWSRRIKWRPSGDKFDTYVCSPDGRTFRSEKELASYFRQIGKVDDIKKYFPVKSFSSPSCDNSETSTMEPLSSSDSESKSPQLSDFAESKPSKRLEECSSEAELEHDNELEQTIGATSRGTIVISNFSTSVPMVSESDAAASSTYSTAEEEITSAGDNSAIDLSMLSDGLDVSDSETTTTAAPELDGSLTKEDSSNNESTKRHKKRSKKKKKRIADSSDNNENESSKNDDLELKSINIVNIFDLPSVKKSCDLQGIADNKNEISADDFVSKEKEEAKIITHESPLLEKPEKAQKLDSNKCITVKNEKPIRKIIKNRKPKAVTNKLGLYSTVTFGKTWSRRIKWNEEGIGKIMSLTSPEGQRIKSSIELLAYFKKSGRTMLSMDYYFPKDIKRSEVEKQLEESNKKAKEDGMTTNHNNENKCQQQIDLKSKPKKVLFTISKNAQPRKKLSKSIDNSATSETNDNSTELKENDPLIDVVSTSKKASINNSAKNALDGGPRIKHVCRSKAQVLGMPRAVFPTPEKESSSSKKKSAKIQKKIIRPVVDRKVGF